MTFCLSRDETTVSLIPSRSTNQAADCRYWVLIAQLVAIRWWGRFGARSHKLSDFESAIHKMNLFLYGSEDNFNSINFVAKTYEFSTPPMSWHWHVNVHQLQGTGVLLSNELLQTDVPFKSNLYELFHKMNLIWYD